MTREILVSITSPLVTGTGAPIIFGLHRLPLKATPIGIRRPRDNAPLASKCIRQDRMSQFVSKSNRKGAEALYLSH
jgi:hypothetical protein